MKMSISRNQRTGESTVLADKIMGDLFSYHATNIKGPIRPAYVIKLSGLDFIARSWRKEGCNYYYR